MEFKLRALGFMEFALGSPQIHKKLHEAQGSQCKFHGIKI